MAGNTDMCKGKFTHQTLEWGNTNSGEKKTKKEKSDFAFKKGVGRWGGASQRPKQHLR